MLLARQRPDSLSALIFGLIFMLYPGKIIQESDKSRDCSQLRLGFIRLSLAGGLLVYYL